MQSDTSEKTTMVKRTRSLENVTAWKRIEGLRLP